MKTNCHCSRKEEYEKEKKPRVHAKRRITYISSILKAFSATKSIEKKPRCSASYGKCSRAFVKNAIDPISKVRVRNSIYF